MQLKITSWNIKNLNDVYPANDAAGRKKKRLKAIKEEILALDADILCSLESVKGSEKIVQFCQEVLEGRYLPVVFDDNTSYDTQGTQWIWYLVKPELQEAVSLLDPRIYDDFAGGSWPLHYWGQLEPKNHSHYRHPQVLVLNWQNTRIELVGVHAKSKFVQRGKSSWEAGGQKKADFINKALKARIKMTTEITNVRRYIDKKFAQVANPAILVMGDLNDGPGKEYFEEKFMFFDLLNNLQGSVFEADKFLNHALFDFPEELRWTCHFKDFILPERNPKILLDHILFTQGFVNGSLPIKVASNAGLVEHEVHDLVNARYPKYAHTSDHKPVSVMLSAL